MSTKDLARTPLEAGHYNGKNQRKRGKNHAPRRTVRQQEREAVNAFDAEDGDFHVDEPNEYTRNSDKLGAVKRWVLSQCGRPWNKVFSEIAEKFDFNTMAGRHILQHVKGYIDFREDHQYRRYSPRPEIDTFYPAYVNDAGMLLKNRYYRRFSSTPRGKKLKAERTVAHKLSQQVKEWAAGRAIGAEGALLFWYSSTEVDVRVWCELQSCHKKHFHDEKAIRACDHFEGSRSMFRFHVERRIKNERIKKLTKEEQAFYFSLPDDFKPSIAKLKTNPSFRGPSKGRKIQ